MLSTVTETEKNINATSEVSQTMPKLIDTYNNFER